MKIDRAYALCATVVLVGCFPVLPHALAQAPVCPDAPSRLSLESGSYSSEPGVSFTLHRFVATLIPMATHAPGCLDKMTDVSHADIFVSNESLTRIFSKKLSTTDSKIRDLKIVHDFGKVTLSGEIVKLVPIKFTIQGPVSTDGTKLSMTANKIDADGIPVKMLLEMVGKHLSSVLAMKDVNGVQVDGNVMSFSPEKVAHLRGYIASVEATPQGLTLHYRHRPTVAKRAVRLAASPS